MEHGEDAGVYKLSDDLAIIQTVDFFTPIVDDPFTFGQVAAVNALSDVYAMGGRPLTAMNIICFPVRKMDLSILQQVLLGGLNKMQEAGVVLVGGHSVEDDELKYGLSVTGVIHPDRVLLNRGARPGDRLILTKPLGTGIVSTAVKGGVADDALLAGAVACMTTLNRAAAELVAQTPGIHACTDITGFGLVGHAAEMIENSDVSIRIRTADVPFSRASASWWRAASSPRGCTATGISVRASLIRPPDVPRGWWTSFSTRRRPAGFSWPWRRSARTNSSERCGPAASSRPPSSGRFWPSRKAAFCSFDPAWHSKIMVVESENAFC